MMNTTFKVSDGYKFQNKIIGEVDTLKSELGFSFIDKIEIAGGEDAPKAALYIINQELMNEPDEAPSAEDATVESPV